MQKSLFRKMLATSMVILISAMIILGGILIIMVRGFWMNEKVSVFKTEVNTLSMQLNQMAGINNMAPQTQRLLSALAVPYKGEMFITNADGTVMISSNEDFVGKTIEKGIVNKFGRIEVTGFSDFNELHYTSSFYYATAFANGYIFAVTPAIMLETYLISMGRIFALASIIVLFFVILIVYYMSFRMTKPLREMSEAAQRMSHGDFTKYIKVERNDEIGELAKAFNHMTKSIAAGEQTRRDFIANVSHELKTPMTVIKGFIDGILDGTIPKEESDNYLEIVSNEIERLSRLVTSMLNLSKLESEEIKLSLHKTDLAKLTVEITVGLEQQINEKNLNILGLESLGESIVMADRDMIYQVIYNLIYNAIKYTPNGGYIKFGSVDNGSTVSMSIRNSGDGIPKEQLPQIFDRFYKVDKSRTDAKSGSGLGLYIVKTIIKRHNGQVVVNSVEGEYAEFIYTLSKPPEQIENTPAKKSKIKKLNKNNSNTKTKED